MKKNLYLFLLLLFASLFSSCSKNVMIEKFDGYVKDIDGNFITKEQLKAKYYFVFYGASWCPYCKDMKDEIKDFYNTYKSKDNFIIIFAGCEKDKSNDDLIKYLEEESYPFYYIDYDKRDECGFFKIEKYTSCEKFYIPAFILYDKEGNILSNSNGPLKSDYKQSRPLEYYKTNIAEVKQTEQTNESD